MISSLASFIHGKTWLLIWAKMQAKVVLTDCWEQFSLTIYYSNILEKNISNIRCCHPSPCQLSSEAGPTAEREGSNHIYKGKNPAVGRVLLSIAPKACLVKSTQRSFLSYIVSELIRSSTKVQAGLQKIQVPRINHCFIYSFNISHFWLGNIKWRHSHLPIRRAHLSEHTSID